MNSYSRSGFLENDDGRDDDDDDDDDRRGNDARFEVDRMVE